MNFCWVSNVAIVFGVIFFINVNSGDLIFDFSVSRHRATRADVAGFLIFLAIRRIAYECSCRVPRFPLKRGNKIHSMSKPDPWNLEALTSLKLTPREVEVLFWISEGKSNQDIGVILGASTGTICKHVEHILSKLNVENRTAAAVVALERCPTALRSETRWGQPQTMFVGLIAQLLADLWSDSCEIYSAITALIA
jgi:DNA-binding CsgD family transcriptional regulator